MSLLPRGRRRLSEQTDLVSIVIATKNRPDSLERLVRSLQRQDYGSCEIIVVDDGSEPPLKHCLAEVRSFRNSKSLGYIPTRNFGISRARGQFIAIFDDDVEVSDTTLLS